ncbi:MAG: hypothetical protein KIG65_09235 [Eubacteriales bacterium]|nr:hypothetical protein [Eubacteriales bacterium]
MKKILLSLILLFILSTTASAQSYLFKSDSTSKFDEAAVVFYDINNNISSVVKTVVKVTDNGFLCSDIDITDSSLTPKLFLPDGTAALNGEPYEEITDKTEKGEYNKDLYIDDGAALFAPAMVSKVRQIYHDDELKNEVTLLYQGIEQSFIFDSSILISETSDSYQAAIGNDSSYLKPGDAIILNHAFINDPRSITFVHRPSNQEPVFDSTLTNFRPLYTNSTGIRNDVAIYSFGVVTEIGDNYLLLTEKDGMERNSKIITFHPDASLYTFNLEDKNTPTIGFAAGIFPSYIAEEDIDQNGNITTWQPQDNRTYALVRLYEDIATDILVYEY